MKKSFLFISIISLISFVSAEQIVAEETTVGDVFRCEVMPTDGYDDGLIDSSSALGDYF